MGRPTRVLLDTTFALRAPHSGTGIYLERLQHALAFQDDVTVLAVANQVTRPDVALFFIAGNSPLCRITRVDGYRQRARERAGHHSWEAVTDQYERLLTSVYEASRPGPLPQTVLEPDLAPVA